VGCRFNIVRFGSSFTSLFSNQVTDEYTDDNMHQAELLIKGMEADMGGTELMGPLRWLAKSKPPPGVVRQIFLLTDGEVTNVDGVINLCRGMAAFTRIFSFGLGHSVNDPLSPKMYIRISACLF
jgi:von Willebrand factor A domain-containing protein 5